jgi:hypothetical protein
MATSDQMAVLGALSKAVGPVVLEESPLWLPFRLNERGMPAWNSWNLD